MGQHGRTILRVTYGSHLFGTATPLSDVDLRGVFVPEPRDILLCRVRGSVAIKRDKAPGEKSHAGDTEEESYSLQRFLGLAAEGQTVAVDMLFAPPSAWRDEPGPEWREILANRHRLLTRKSKAFIGYCRQQAAKYGVKGTRVAAVRAALALLEAGATRHGAAAKVASLDAEIRGFADGAEHALVVDIAQPSGRLVPHLEVCGRKLPYTVAIKEAAGVMRRLLADYGRRALQAESQDGVDWKALSHAVRVATQGLELLSTGHVTLPSADAGHLLAIKTGQVAYGAVVDEIERLLSEVEQAVLRSRLPDEVDRGWIDDFVAEVHGREIRSRAA